MGCQKGNNIYFDLWNGSESDDDKAFCKVIRLEPPFIHRRPSPRNNEFDVQNFEVDRVP